MRLRPLFYETYIANGYVREQPTLKLWKLAPSKCILEARIGGHFLLLCLGDFMIALPIDHIQYERKASHKLAKCRLAVHCVYYSFYD